MMPFPGGPESLPNGTLLFSAALAFFYLLIQQREPSWRRTVAKAGSVALLAVLALLQGGPMLLIAALLLSAAGDAFLAQNGERAFLGGLASFLTAHLVYVLLFVLAGSGIEILTAQWWRIVLPVLAIVLGAVLLAKLLRAAPHDLRAPITLYVAAIAAMMVTAATVPVPLVMFGAALFVLSDAILAIDRFLLSPNSAHKAWAGSAVWVLYYLAQAAITLGFLL